MEYQLSEKVWECDQCGSQYFEITELGIVCVKCKMYQNELMVTFTDAKIKTGNLVDAKN